MSIRQLTTCYFARAALAALVLSAAASGCVVERTIVDQGGAGGSSETSGPSSSAATVTTGSGNATTTSSGGQTSSSSGSGGSGACGEHLDCGKDEVCVAGSCEYAWARDYSVWVDSADIVGGSKWDGVGSPDPYVEVFLNDSLIVATPYIDGTSTPAWDKAFGLVFFGAPTKSLKFQLWDFDDNNDDKIAEWDAPLSDWLKVLKVYGPTFAMAADDGTTLTVSIFPN